MRKYPRLSMSLSAAIVLLGALFAGRADAADLTLRWLREDGSVVSERQLDLAQIEALPQQEIATSTPWTTGVKTFRGPALADLAALADAPAREANVLAHNDYAAIVPREDWTEHGAMLAARLDGSTMRIRDKGPYWIMFPIDASDRYDSQVYRSRMVWQVRSIDFLVD